MNQPAETVQQRIRFEEVTPANTDAAFLDASIESLVAPLGLPIYDGYDGLDDLQLTFLTLPSGATVTLASYLNSPQPGTSIHVDSAMQNIPQIVFESCQQLQVSREEALWFHPDWQDEIDDRFETLRERLCTEHGAIEKRPELSQLEELPQQNQYEPIDCFNHALRIYTREYVPATYWAMLQRNLGLAYFNRNQGDRRENLERSIECFNKSLEVYRQDEFPEKWKINQEDLRESYRELKLLPEAIQNGNNKLIGEYIIRTAQSHESRIRANLIRANLMIFPAQSHFALLITNLLLVDQGSIRAHPINVNLRGFNLRDANLIGVNLRNADLSNADLRNADLTGANLRNANLRNADLSGANLRSANLVRTDLSNTSVTNTQFAYSTGISASLKRDLINRGAIFDDIRADEYESRTLVPH